MSAFFALNNEKNKKKLPVYDFLTYIGYEYPYDIFQDDNPLWLFGIAPFCAEVSLFVVHLFIKLVRESNWLEIDKKIWMDRYIFNKPSKDIAKRIKCDSVWVSGRFYKTKQNLARMVRAWWNEQLADNPEETLPKIFD